MTAQPAQAAYVPLFVSENVGPPPYDDCLPSAGLMALAAWTNGEVLLNPDWTQKSPAERTVLRERMRNTLPPAKQHGYLTTADLETMKEALWSYLPHVPFYDAASELRTWDQVMALLRSGDYGGLALGNPSRAPAASKLRRWTAGDDYSHFIWLDRANADSVKVFNPLAEYAGYEGEFVRIADVKAFCNVDAGGHVAVGIYKRGDQSTQAIVARGLREAAAKAAELHQKALDGAKAIIAKLQDQLDATVPTVVCADAVAAAVAPLQARIDAAKAALA